MNLLTLHHVLLHEIEDLHSAETQIVKALPKMAEKALSKKLRKAFEDHLEESYEHVSRLEEAAEELNVELPGKTCKGMQGLLEEGAELLKQEQSPALDAALIAAAQRVEHYEIAAYGSAVTFAKMMDHKNTVHLLKKTLDEEEKTDKLLSKLAESGINEAANEQ
jgi:ferritin-like metal-binding protein YciE